MTTELQLEEPRAESVGTLIGVDSPALTEMISALGFNFLFVDLEHGSVNDSSLVSHVMAARVPVLARLADQNELAVKRAADAGVHALVVPHVSSRTIAANIVRWAKYPPVGERSVGLSRNTLLGLNLAAALQDTDRPAVIAQIEDAEGVANVDEICAVNGIDGIFIGPYDLSASLGEPGNLSSKAVHDAIEKIVKAARSAGITVGVFAPTVAAWAAFREQGCEYVVLSSDSLLLANGAKQVLEEMRALTS
jgi:2-dehydro-3-deoxyglucarate aldolase